MSSVLQQQLCQHINISPHDLLITQIWVNLATTLTVQGCTHMPIHSIWTCSNTFYICNMGVEKKWLVFYSSNHVNTSLFHPTIPRLPHLGQLGQQCNCVRVHPYASPQHMNALKHSLYTIWMWRRSEWYCTASATIMPKCHYFTPPSPNYPNLGQLDQQCSWVQGCTHMPIHIILMH